MEDQEHPTDPDRSRLQDIETMLEKYQRNRTNRGLENTYNVRETRALVDRINEEYPRPTKMDWFEDLKQGQWRAPEEFLEDAVVAEGEEASKFESKYDGFDQD